jgi:phasin family protein
MEESRKPSQDMSGMVTQSIEQAGKAMENYLQFFQKSMSGTPWGKTDLSEKVKSYAEQNVAAAFEFAQKLTKAKDLQDLVRIQTEFFQTQLKSMTDQTKGLAETATKATTDASKDISS